MPRTPATWRDGQPVTLPAAAADALQWLPVLRQLCRQTLTDAARARLDRCITALEAALAGVREVHETTAREE